MEYRLADHHIIPLAYTGSKAKIAPLLARLRPWEFLEYREPFVGSGAMFNQIRRFAPCRSYWINDIDRRVVAFHRVLRDDADAFINRLLDIHADHGGGTQELFDLWMGWRNSSDLMDLAISAFLRGLIVRGSEMKCFGFANSRVITGKAITHSKIIRLWGFAELLQGVKITDMDYREVMAAYGQDAFIFADPPYEVAGEECYDHGQFDLGEFTTAIDHCRHSCLWTLNCSATTMAAFSRHNVIVHSMHHSANGHAAADEIIGANYTTPLFETHARDIGTLLHRISNRHNEAA
ncbi:site-specific DNA methylase [Paramagnetospirillum caucaseum]|uniref:site-specific DNA-methyltransferase (adenine-specific) n=1 Tax=Paramagnetospirillum caucaseum TaxID=1244869 RepID=M2Z2L5_9PROT|nr:DNA adenine methylase [Paramagnetospirillum caucaseum]EME68560.1 site-specific DNA methylase [Paramagnetospirillum caucaseum]